MQNGRYDQAFQVAADAVYRFPKEKLFQQNCKAAFERAGMIDWQNKDWNSYHDRMWEFIDLDIISKAEAKNYISRLGHWKHYMNNFGNPEHAAEVEELIDLLAGIKSD